MKQYQAVIVRLKQRSREDEEAVTDLLNERARVGWHLHRLTAIEGGRVLVVFARDA